MRTLDNRFTAGPVTTHRIAGLDVLRGIAIFGILIVNVEQMFLPQVIANDPVEILPGSVGSMTAWFITDAVFESKFLTIFSLLFGAGFCLQWMRYQSLQKPFTGLYLRRIAMLIVFGLVHATFFYYADVLVLYGLTALGLFLFRHRSARVMIRTGTIMLTLMTLWHILLSGPDPDGAALNRQVVDNLTSIRDDKTAVLAGETYALPVPDAVVASHLTGDIHSADEATAQALAWGEGPVRLAIKARLVLFSMFIKLFTPLFLLWRTLGIFLIAAGLVKRGFLEAGARQKWKRTAILGFSLGIPMTIAASTMQLAMYESPGPLAFVGVMLHDVSALLLAAAISALVFLLCTGGTLHPIARAFAAVGRLALTNYIGQSIVLCVLSTSIGFAWFGRLSRLEMLLLCIPLFALQIAASTMWTRRFRMGPLEWIWRRVTYGRLPS